MSKNHCKYRMVMNGESIWQFKVRQITRLIEQWVRESEVKNVSSGVIRADVDNKGGVVIYSAHFDSSHWTGIGFKGFDKKHPGEPQTL